VTGLPLVCAPRSAPRTATAPRRATAGCHREASVERSDLARGTQRRPCPVGWGLVRRGFLVAVWRCCVAQARRARQAVHRAQRPPDPPARGGAACARYPAQLCSRAPPGRTWAVQTFQTWGARPGCGFSRWPSRLLVHRGLSARTATRAAQAHEPVAPPVADGGRVFWRRAPSAWRPNPTAVEPRGRRLTRDDRGARGRGCD